jgi:hypothetical protein
MDADCGQLGVDSPAFKKFSQGREQQNAPPAPRKRQRRSENAGD